jgi:hypothetical protein
MRGLPQCAAGSFERPATENADRPLLCEVVRVRRASPCRRRPVGFSPDRRSQRARRRTSSFSKVARLLVQWGIGDDLKKIEEAWLQTKVVSRKHYEPMLRLLEVFAQHLSLVASQLIIQCKQSEPSSIVRAQRFILESLGEEPSLATVAKRRP